MRPRDYYERIDDRSQDWSGRASEPGFAPVADVIHAAQPFLTVGGRILDIGCQGGHQLALLQADYSEAYGIDIAHYTTMWAAFEGIHFRTHDVDAEPLPFPDSFFDTVVATNILEHVFDVFGFIKEVRRVLRVGGTAVVSVPNIAEIRRIRSLLLGRLPLTGGTRYPFTPDEGWDGQHLHYFTPSALRQVLSEYQLEVVQTLIIGRFGRMKRLCPHVLCSSVDFVVQRVSE